MIKYFYSFVFKNKFIILFLLSIVFSSIIYNVKNLEVDASAETLLLNDDKDLAFSRKVNKQYDNKNFLILTYTPIKNDLLSIENINAMKVLIDKLEQIDNIDSTLSILNVPLLESPIIPLGELKNGAPTINDNFKDCIINKSCNKIKNMSLIKNEFLNSELYKNSLVSNDFKTTSIILYLKNDYKYFELLNNRNRLLNNKIDSKEYNIELSKIEDEFKNHRNTERVNQSNNINEIRNLISNDSNAKIFLGGVNIISNDVINYIKNDLSTYGIGLFIVVSIVLYFMFKSIRWVLIPILISFVSVLTTAGILGLLNLEITVISSNFISLQLILTLSLIIHLMIRYQEVYIKYKKSSQKNLVLNTMLSKLNPSVFATLTTIVGFSSLIVSKILPIKDLGIMMSLGVATSLFIVFIIFPIVLMIIGKREESFIVVEKYFILEKLIYLIINKKKTIYLFSIFILFISLFFSTQLLVENSFINYFKKDSNIYKSMIVIDDQLGGTTPLDLIVKFKKIENQNNDSFEGFEDDFEDKENQDAYWFSNDKIELIKKIHTYLESKESIGKISSFESLLRIGKKLNDNEELDSISLSILYKKIPEGYKEMVLTPYININDNEVRFTMRIIDSLPKLRRNDLLNEINNELNIIIGDKAEYRLTGLMVLYNNMLQSLFDSQIESLSLVLLLILIMFYFTFKSIKLAIIGLLSNLIPISLIFGVMGFFVIPLDIMTITIAAISIGIGVDDTIHYIHRYKEEYRKTKDKTKAMVNSHKSIGFAMYYTTLVIIMGFAVLLFSNLIPTIYFALLTIIVMISMLASAMILLPTLLINIKKI